MDKAGIFDFRTIASGETIREPVNTFREFSQFTHRMPSHKASGFSLVPADLFKQAPAPFQRRMHLLVNEILFGEYDGDPIPGGIKIKSLSIKIKTSPYWTTIDP